MVLKYKVAELELIPDKSTFYNAFHKLPTIVDGTDIILVEYSDSFEAWFFWLVYEDRDRNKLVFQLMDDPDIQPWNYIPEFEIEVRDDGSAVEIKHWM